MKGRIVAGVATGLVLVATFVTLYLAPSATPPGPLLAVGGSSTVVCNPSGALSLAGVSERVTQPLTPTLVAKAAHAAGFRGDDLVIAVAVAKAESGWSPRAINQNTNGSADYGLFQVNSIHQAILARGDWRDPADNAEMAFQIWTDAGGSWSPWVTYWRGTYRQFLSDAQQAVSGVADAAATITGCSRDVVAAGGLSDPGPGPQAADGMRPRGTNIRALTRSRWGCKAKSQPCISSIGGYAYRTIAGTNKLSDHATGNAVDIMLPKNYKSPAANALGWEIANFWADNAKAVGVKYVIFDDRIKNTGDTQWRPYGHPIGIGNDTYQHRDHVHVSTVG